MGVCPRRRGPALLLQRDDGPVDVGGAAEVRPRLTVVKNPHWCVAATVVRVHIHGLGAAAASSSTLLFEEPPGNSGTSSGVLFSRADAQQPRSSIKRPAHANKS